jgi:predicted GIY-YIG superfamily endonuclease
MKHIYLLKLESSDSYKIGISKDPKKRIKQLQTGSPDNILLVCSYESKWANKIESALHRRYTMNNINREWFHFENFTKDYFLSECLTIDNNFKFLEANATKLFF